MQGSGGVVNGQERPDLPGGEEEVHATRLVRGSGGRRKRARSRDEGDGTGELQQREGGLQRGADKDAILAGGEVQGWSGTGSWRRRSGADT